MDRHSIVISNGYGQFHLARLAENLSRTELLSKFLTGAYVRMSVKRFPGMFRPARRLLERKIGIPGQQVQSFWRGEAPHQIAQRLRRAGRDRQADYFVASSLDSYARWAAKRVRTAAAAGGVYHFRAGMGGKSIAVASALGMTTICDHSIAHPRLLAGLVDGSNARATTLSPLWQRVERDIAEADGVIVNSDFVARTCVEAGVAASKLHVAYTGVDPDFLRTIDRAGERDFTKRPQVLFAGTLERRKGVDTYVEAVRLFDANSADWLLVGSWQPDSTHVRARVPAHLREVARLPRLRLAETIARSDVFVFPSRAEGSARVVAEALTAGCFVIATPQTGSVVRDGVDGRLVEPGDIPAVRWALEEYFAQSPEARAERARNTREYARAVLSERSYTASVLDAYRLISKI